MIRCAWANTELSIPYHDREWGVPLHDDRKLFEFLILEGAQAGLSWETILKKRDNYRAAFDNMIVLSVAMALVIIAGGIDLSMGGVLSMCGVIMALCLRNGMHTLIAIGIGLATGALFGLLNGIIVTRMDVPPFIATFGSMGIAQSVANTLSNRRTVHWDSGSHSSLMDLLKGDVVRLELGRKAAWCFTSPSWWCSRSWWWAGSSSCSGGLCSEPIPMPSERTRRWPA